MNIEPNHHHHHHRRSETPIDELKAEIRYFERRLRAIGSIGESAYEKSLARTYRSLLDERRRQLAALEGH